MVTGQKVVCVDDKFPDWVKEFYTCLPKKGTVYLVRNVVLGTGLDGVDGEVAVYLVGHHNPLGPPPACSERGYRADRFRPIEEKTVTEEVEKEEYAFKYK